MDEALLKLLAAAPHLATAGLFVWTIFRILDRIDSMMKRSNEVMDAMIERISDGSEARQDKYEAALQAATKAMADMTAALRTDHRK